MMCKLTFLIGAFTFMNGNVSNELIHDYCRYEFHLQPLNWVDASEICKRKNRTLVEVNDADELKLIVDITENKVYSRVPGYPYPSTDIWIGLRAYLVDGSIRHIWENCGMLEENYDIWENSNSITMEGCVSVKWNDTKYSVHNCINESKPYICESAISVPCFNEVTNWIEHPTVFSSLANLKVVSKTDLNSCKDECIGDALCISFQLSGVCKLFRYTNIQAAPDLNERTLTAYWIGFIDISSYAVNIATIPPNTCTRSNSPVQVQESSNYTPMMTTVPTGMNTESTGRDTVSNGRDTTAKTTNSDKDDNSSSPSGLIESSFTSVPFENQDVSSSVSILTPELPSESYKTFPASKDRTSSVQTSSLDVHQTSDSPTQQMASQMATTLEVSTNNLPMNKDSIDQSTTAITSSGFLSSIAVFEASDNSLKQITSDEKSTSTDRPFTSDINQRSDHSAQHMPSEMTTCVDSSSYTESMAEESSTDQVSSTDIPQMSYHPKQQMSTKVATAVETSSYMVTLSQDRTRTNQLSLSEVVATSDNSIQHMTSEVTTLAESSSKASSITTTLSRNLTSANSAGCMCPCSMYRNTTYTPEELDSRIKEIKEALTVNRKDTSVHRRSLISAPDERLSVKRIGYVGVSIMAALCVLIVLMDMPRSISCLKDFLRQCK